MESLTLRVRSGLHAGASVELHSRTDWSIGSGMQTDVLLLDEDIREINARLTWMPEAAGWYLLACADNIRVFGYALKESLQIPVTACSQFTIGSVQCELVAGDSTESPDNAGAAVNAAAARHRAKMLFLQHAFPWHHRLHLVKAAARPLNVLVLFGALSASAAITAVVLSKPQLAQQLQEEENSELSRLYPDVGYFRDKVTGFVTYYGYVKDQRELGALRQLTLKGNNGAVVMNVLPMDVLVSNVSSLIARHYKAVDVTATGPGVIEGEIASEDTIKDLDGWNIAGVRERVLRELPDVKAFTLLIKPKSSTSVRAPLAQLGLSIVSSSVDVPFVVTPRGDKLFTGASMKEGRIGSITPCKVQLVSSKDTTIFEMSTREEKDDCN